MGRSGHAASAGSARAARAVAMMRRIMGFILRIRGTSPVLSVGPGFLQSREALGIDADLAQDLLGVLTALRRRARDLRRRARHDDGLAHEHLLAETRRDDFLQHAEVLHLRLLERLLDIVDAPARDTGIVQLLDPVVAGLLLHPLLDLVVEPVAILAPRHLVLRALVVDPFRRTQRLAEALPDPA